MMKLFKLGIGGTTKRTHQTLSCKVAISSSPVESLRHQAPFAGPPTKPEVPLTHAGAMCLARPMASRNHAGAMLCLVSWCRASSNAHGGTQVIVLSELAGTAVTIWPPFLPCPQPWPCHRGAWSAHTLPTSYAETMKYNAPRAQF
jgi:hypothetical protein